MKKYYLKKKWSLIVSPLVGCHIAGIIIPAQMAARGNRYYAKECVSHNMLLRSIPLNFAEFVLICLFLVFRWWIFAYFIISATTTVIRYVSVAASITGSSVSGMDDDPQELAPLAKRHCHKIALIRTLNSNPATYSL